MGSIPAPKGLGGDLVDQAYESAVDQLVSDNWISDDPAKSTNAATWHTHKAGDHAYVAESAQGTASGYAATNEGALNEAQLANLAKHHSSHFELSTAHAVAAAIMTKNASDITKYNGQLSAIVQDLVGQMNANTAAVNADRAQYPATKVRNYPDEAYASDQQALMKGADAQAQANLKMYDGECAAGAAQIQSGSFNPQQYMGMVSGVMGGAMSGIGAAGGVASSLGQVANPQQLGQVLSSSLSGVGSGGEGFGQSDENNLDTSNTTGTDTTNDTQNTQTTTTTDHRDNTSTTNTTNNTTNTGSRFAVDATEDHSDTGASHRSMQADHSDDDMFTVFSERIN